MLFSSFSFLFLFLPVVLLGYYLLYSRQNRGTLLGWLIGSSLVFYTLRHPAHLVLLLGMLAANYLFSLKIAHSPKKRAWLIFAIGIDLAVLGWFKYSIFFREFPLLSPWISQMLPLGISFYTFQMIAYLVDIYRRQTPPASWQKFVFFILFFPQLIAGPIVHYAQIFPQLRTLGKERCCEDAAIGTLFFVIGLTKKVLLADTFARFADRVFHEAALGTVPGFWDAWQGLIAYSLQIYFDFCAYSEMAIGLGLLFGIRLPVNFLSPYKSQGFRDFWRRWHITLSRFLRDYLYIPLGGNRKGQKRTLLNVVVVMTLAGAWHGAGWTFVAWGMAHGCLIALAHLRKLWSYFQSPLLKPLRIFATFLSVTLLWVLFRSDSFESAARYYRGLFTFEPWAIDTHGWRWAMLHFDHFAWGWILAGLFIVWALPNVKEMLGYEEKVTTKLLTPTIWHGIATGVLAWIALKTLSEAPSRAFIYFAF